MRSQLGSNWFVNDRQSVLDRIKGDLARSRTPPPIRKDEEAKIQDIPQLVVKEPSSILNSVLDESMKSETSLKQNSSLIQSNLSPIRDRFSFADMQPKKIILDPPSDFSNKLPPQQQQQPSTNQDQDSSEDLTPDLFQAENTNMNPIDISQESSMYREPNNQIVEPRLEVPNLDAMQSERKEGADYNTASFNEGNEKEKFNSQAQYVSEPKALAVNKEEYLTTCLKHMMTPTIMKISLENSAFNSVMFQLCLRPEDTPGGENFILEWLNFRTLKMIGYIKCKFMRAVKKETKTKFWIECAEAKTNPNEREKLHYVQIEANDPELCEFYVSGLNAIIESLSKKRVI